MRGGWKRRRRCGRRHDPARGGLACPVLSVGSTPTAHSATDLTGVTEVRAGVFMFSRSRDGRGGRLPGRGHRCLRARDGHRAPAREGMDSGRRGLDGDVAGPRYTQAGDRPGLRAGVRYGLRSLCRLDRCRCEPGARHHHGAAQARAACFRTSPSATACGFCRTTLAPRAPSIAAITSSTAAPTSVEAEWPRFGGWQ